MDEFNIFLFLALAGMLGMAIRFGMMLFDLVAALVTIPWRKAHEWVLRWSIKND